jgi:dTDP-glucose 4,6-dehydratase
VKTIVTGGAGFIGSNLIKYLIKEFPEEKIINLDKLTYAGNLLSLKNVEDHGNYKFDQVDICNYEQVSKIFKNELPDNVIHLAAESHVDRSIAKSFEFMSTNILGTFTLLEVIRKYLQENNKTNFKFLHVSTDEVYGDLSKNAPSSTETSPYKPSSPYAASKASSDHLVRAWARTYKIPCIITNCTNNYGPFQYPEKLIPVTINNIISGKAIPIYGDGEHTRDWLFVDDHVKAIKLILENGTIGETYNISADNEISNILLVNEICKIIETNFSNKLKNTTNLKKLISFVEDRKGHDIRYSLNSNKLRNTLGWKPEESFSSGLKSTIEWYIENQNWCKEVLK